jgi:hypothetical protein
MWRCGRERPDAGPQKEKPLVTSDERRNVFDVISVVMMIPMPLACPHR